MAAHHLELIKLVLNSYGGKATADQIQQVLVPDVIQDDWKKWWEAARREMKKDGHFIVPLKKTEPIVYQAQETSLQDRLLADFRAAKGLKARVAVVGGNPQECIPDLADKAAAANEIIAGAERGHCLPPAHPAGGGAGGDFCARRIARGRRTAARRRTKSPPRKSGCRTASNSARCWSRFPPPNIIARWNRSRRRTPTAGTDVLRGSLNIVSAKLCQANSPAC